MCGIIGYIGERQDAAQQVFTGLKKLEYRGYDSWGVVVIPNEKKGILCEKRVGKIGLAEIALPPGTTALGHTRWATHGGVTEENAHPHFDCQKSIAIVHNGIVENYQEIKEKLEKEHNFLSQTDTEVIVHLIEDFRKKGFALPEAVFRAFNHLQGSNAIAVLDETGEMIVSCRKGSPVVVGVGDGEYFLASDIPPFLPFTNQVIFMQDNEGIILTKKEIQLFDLTTGRKKEYPIEQLSLTPEDAERGSYPHFLLKEIFEQKETIPKTAMINETAILDVAEKIKEGHRIVLVACGTASYCAIAAKYFFAYRGFHAEAYGAYEFVPFSSFYGTKTLFFAISQSGETADTIIAAKMAKKNGAHIVAVVNARGSTLERMADVVLPVGAGPEIAVVSTKAFTAQLTTLYLLAMAAHGKYNEGKEKVKTITELLRLWLDEKMSMQIKTLAQSILHHKNLFVLGKHLNYPTALEFALKIKETSYLHAEAFASGELKHGVIALIEKDTPCFILAANDEVKKEVLAGAAEVKARGGYVIGVAPFQDQVFDALIQTPDVEELTLLPNVIVGQLLGYYFGIAKAVDPDKPRNLAKSVTVK